MDSLGYPEDKKDDNNMSTIQHELLISIEVATTDQQMCVSQQVIDFIDIS